MDAGAGAASNTADGASSLADNGADHLALDVEFHRDARGVLLEALGAVVRFFATGVASPVAKGNGASLLREGTECTCCACGAGQCGGVELLRHRGRRRLHGFVSWCWRDSSPDERGMAIMERH